MTDWSWIGGALPGFFGLLVVAMLCISLFLRKSILPQATEQLVFKGLKETVDVLRESNGVVHICAKNEEDLFFAQGLVHAQDRLWQMEFQRRTGAGRLAEILGLAVLERDRFLRTWGFYRAAQTAYESLSAQTKAVLHAYVAGINAYLTSNPSLPLEFKLLGFKPELWTPLDVLVWSKMMSFSLSNNWNIELLRYNLLAKGLSHRRIAELTSCAIEDMLAAQLEKNLSQPDEKQPEEVLVDLAGQFSLSPEASNNWAVDGKHTMTGKPMLANDPHLPLSVPSLWYFNHLETPQLTILGASLPGIPGITIGRNKHISWGITNALTDVQDLYILEETPDHTGYLYKDTVHPYRIYEEVIRVKNHKPVPIILRESIYGPVISDVIKVPGKKPLALRWVSLDPGDRSLDAHLEMNRAMNWDEFKRALQKHTAPCMNFVYADREGNIGHVVPGKIPLRKPGHTGLYPVPGTGDWDWQGFIPFDELPQRVNPPEGVIVTANNDITPPDYPYPLGLDWAEPYRAERIRELLLRKERLSLEDMVAIQQDRVSSLYRAFRPLIEHMNPQSESARTWRKRLLDWDGDTHPASQETTVFEAWYIELTRLPRKEVQQDFWDKPRYLLKAMREECSTDQTLSVDRSEYAALALECALSRLGRRIPVWGKLHHVAFKHPIFTHTPLKWLSNRRVVFGGDQSTVNVGTFNFTTWLVDSAATCRMVIDLASMDQSIFIYPMGQSGNLFSRHYANFLPLWKRGAYVTLKTAEYKITRRLQLKPDDTADFSLLGARLL